MIKGLLDNDAEIGVLSILLRFPSKVYELESLKTFMFSSLPNQTLFECILEISLSTLPEYNLLLNTLQAKNKLEDCGGESYLKYLVELDYESANLKDFENLVIGAYKTRSVLSLVSRVPSLVADKTGIDDTIHYLTASLDNLTLVRNGESVTPLYTATQELWDNLLLKIENPGKIEVTTGFKDLDLVTGGYKGGDMWIIAGRPGMGKTSWICNSLLTVAKAGHAVLFFSLEMPRKTLATRLVSIETGIPITNIELGLVNQSELNQISETIKVIKDLPIFIDTNFNSSNSYIVSTIRKYKKIEDIKIFFLDYIQLLIERGIYSTHELGKVSRDIKLIANELDITGVVCSQLHRGVESRDDKRPILSDLRQSGNLEEDADIALFLYRDKIYNEKTKYKELVEFLLRKHRNGPTGVMSFKFEEENNRITGK